VQHRWPCSFAVWGIIYQWIWLFLLTERDSTDKHFRRNKMTHLWQSLLQLSKNDSFSSIVSWSSKDCRVFKLNNSEKVAQRRGMLKRNKATSYKKLSRALPRRYHYQQGNIQKVGQYISVLVSAWRISQAALISGIFKLNCSKSFSTLNFPWTLQTVSSLKHLNFPQKTFRILPNWITAAKSINRYFLNNNGQLKR